jgi:uncharacterized protein YndB with AHSA1/START domain
MRFSGTMMKFLKKLLISIGILAAFALVVSLLLPGYYRVERSTLINAPANTVFQQVADFQQWKSWNVWEKGNANAASSNPSTGVDAWREWKNGPEGSVKATSTYQEAGSDFVYRMLFENHQIIAMGAFKVQPEGDGTRIHWTIADKVGINPIKRWFALAYSFKVGDELDGGLANLKRVCESAGRVN